MDDREERLANIIGEIQDALNRGEMRDRARWTEKYPDFADDLDMYFDCGSILAGALEEERPRDDDSSSGDLEKRLDLRAFPVKRRLPDVPLGTVHLLRSAAKDDLREIVVLRGWFTPPERERIERALHYAMERPIAGLCRILEVGRLNHVLFALREHHVGTSLDALIRQLVASGGRRNAAQLLDGAPDETPRARSASADVEEPAQVAELLVQDRRHLLRLARLFFDWASILERSHAEGMPHLEIDPSALRLDVGGRAAIQGAGLVWAGTGIRPENLREWSPRWLAPEVLDPSWGPLTFMADVWGLGLSFAAALALTSPLAELKGLGQQIAKVSAGSNAILESLPSRTPPELRRLLTDCLQAPLIDRLRGMGVFRRRLAEIFDFEVEAKERGLLGAIVDGWKRRRR